MPRSHTYAGKDPTEYECFKFCRVLEKVRLCYLRDMQISSISTAIDISGVEAIT